MADQPTFTVSYVTRNDVIEIARFSGSLKGGESITPFHGHIHQCVDRGIKLFCFNLAEVDHINSVGLGMLISALTTIKNANGKLRLCDAPANAWPVFEITRTRFIFDWADTEEQALDILSRNE